jgi:predicted transcriptional regulator of viral defense system
MQPLTDRVYERIPSGIFAFRDVTCLVDGSNDKQYNLVKRAVATGEIIQVRRGLYCLAAKYHRERINPFSLSQLIYGPSYVSLESALSWHGWIPEAVYTVTCVSYARSNKFDTPFGQFNYTRVPQNVLYAEVDRHAQEKQCPFLMATAIKALADYVYVYKKDWKSIDPVIKSMRVEEGSLRTIRRVELETLVGNYTNYRVRQFLEGLAKDLKL